MAEEPKPVQQESRKVAGFRSMKFEDGPMPVWTWKPIDYTPKVSLQKKISKALKQAGDLTPDKVMPVVDQVLASIKPDDRDEALRTALLICTLRLANPQGRVGGRPGGEPKDW